MDDDVYDALYSILTGEKSLHDWPKKGDKGLRQRVYRKLKSDIYAVKEIHDPTVGKPKKRIVEKATNCIVVKKSDVSQLVDSAYYETKAEGAKKLSKQMAQMYRGLSRRIIQIPVAIVSSLGETGLKVIPLIVKTKRKLLEIWPYLAMKLSFIIIAWNQWLLRIPN